MKPTTLVRRLLAIPPAPPLPAWILPALAGNSTPLPTDATETLAALEQSAARVVALREQLADLPTITSTTSSPILL